MENEIVDYFTYIPSEIFEAILLQLNALDLGRLKQISKKFNNSLDNATAWRKIFDERFNLLIHDIEYFDADNINWSKEMNLLAKIRANKKISAQRPPVLCVTLTPPTDLKTYKNHLIVDNYAPVDITSLTKNRTLSDPLYKDYIIIGGHAGRAEPDPPGCHQFVDLFTEKTPLVYKRLFESTRGTLISFNKTLAVLDHLPKFPHISIWNLSVHCKHTDEVLWKRSTKKKEFCEECAFVCKIDYVLEQDFLVSYYCSQINQKLVFNLTYANLHVMLPLKGTSFEIQNETGPSCINWEIGDFKPPEYTDSHYVEAEQLISIGGSQHHIVHCVVGNQHRFYDVTDKTLLAMFNRGTEEKWIPNTCYFALALGGRVTVIDFYQKKIVSRFIPVQLSKSSSKADWKTRLPILSIEASRSGTILFIAKQSISSKSMHVFVCSAMTGAQFGSLCLHRAAGTESYCKLLLNDDETKLILWEHCSAYNHDLRDMLRCLQPNFKKSNK